jgi:hypothetical protein
MMNKNEQHGRKIINSGKDLPLMRKRGVKLSVLILSALMLAAGLSPAAHAHRGDSDEADPCRVKIGDEWLHFSAYTPKFSGSKSFCRSIPKVGMTNLVFDYEGDKLRAVSMEFEVTKEPEGTRVYYRAPDTTKSGTVDGTVDFSQFGPGNYRAHVTLVDQGEKVDTHIPFSVGIEGDETFIKIKKFLYTFLVCVAIVLLSVKYARSGKTDKNKSPKASDQ